MIEVLHRRYGTRVDLLSSGSWTPAILADDPPGLFAVRYYGGSVATFELTLSVKKKS